MPGMLFSFLLSFDQSVSRKKATENCCLKSIALQLRGNEYIISMKIKEDYVEELLKAILKKRICYLYGMLESGNNYFYS